MLRTLIFSLVLGAAVLSNESWAHPTQEVGAPENAVPEHADLEYIDDEDEDGGRSLFSIIKIVATQGIKQGVKQGVKQTIKQGIKHGAKVVGSAIIKGATKVVKSGVMKAGKKLVWKGTKKVVKMAAEELAMAGIEAGVSALVPSGEEVEEGEEYEEVEEVDLFDFLADDELCDCPTTSSCECCAEVPDYEQACLNLTFVDGGSLWKAKSEIRVSTFYGGEKAMIHKLPVNADFRKCRRLPESMESVRMCISSLGRQKEGQIQTQCFSLEFNGHSLMKCMQQTKEGTLKMGMV